MENDPKTVDSVDARPQASADPGIDHFYQYLMVGLSLPERAVRGTAAMVGGAINESASLLVPQAFQDSKTYNTFVKQMLEVVANDVGGVAKPNSETGEQDPEVEHFVARKTVSTFIDLAGMATLHASPLTIMAIVGDVAYGSKTYLDELTVELKREGIIKEDSVINDASELLDAVGAASSDAADALDLPPVSVDGLRETVQRTRDSVANIDPSLLIPESEMKQLWSDMRAIADKEDINIFEVSSAMTMYTLGQVTTVNKGALTTIRVTSELIDRHLFEHYRHSLNDINERGIYRMLAESIQPYLDAVWFNFSANRPTLTEDMVSGKMAGRIWNGVRGRLGGR